MGRKLTFEVTVPEGLKPGDKFQAEVELPTPQKSKKMIMGYPDGMMTIRGNN